MSIIRNNKNYGTKVKIEQLQPNPFVEYLTGVYNVTKPTTEFKILENTNNINGWRFKGETEWRTPVTTIEANQYGILEIEFDLVDETDLTRGQFNHCSNLRQVKMTSTLNKINCFCSSGLVEFPNLQNVTYIGEDCFYSCPITLLDLTINNDVDYSGWHNKCFNTYQSYKIYNKIYVNGSLYEVSRGMTGDLDLSDGIDGLPIYKWFAVGYNQQFNLSSLKMPRTLTHIIGQAFDRCRVDDVYFYNTTPPTAMKFDSDVVFIDPDNVTNIYVPAASLDAYKATFSNVADKIQAMP